MDIGIIIESVLKIGLAPTLLILVLYWNKDSYDKHIKGLEEQVEHLRKQNEKLLGKIIEKGV